MVQQFIIGTGIAKVLGILKAGLKVHEPREEGGEEKGRQLYH
jgi:hypothetical protein